MTNILILVSRNCETCNRNNCSFWVTEVLCSYMYLKILIQFDNFIINFIKILLHIEKTIYLNQRNISLVYGQRKILFELKKVLLIEKNYLWSKEMYLFRLKKIFGINKAFFNSKKFFLVPYIKETVFWLQFDSFKIHFMKFQYIFSNFKIPLLKNIRNIVKFYVILL